MRIGSLHDLFVEQLKDLYSAEHQVQQAYRRWKSEATSDDLQQLFDDHLKTSAVHQRRIHKIAETLNVSPTGEKCRAMEGLIQEGDDFLGQVTDDDVCDAGLVAMAQRVEHYGITGYGSARTYARRLGYDDAADRLQKTLEEEAQMDERMTQLAEGALNPEAVAV